MNKLPFNPPNMCTTCGGYTYKPPKVLNPKKCECPKIAIETTVIAYSESYCPACGGTGYYSLADELICNECQGGGFVYDQIIDKVKTTSVTFQDFVKNNPNELGVVGSEYRLVVSSVEEDGSIIFYCHPFGRSGETYDGVLTKFNIYPKVALDNLLKHIYKK